MYLFIYKERERLRVTCGFGDTFLLPGAFYLLKYNSLFREPCS